MATKQAGIPWWYYAIIVVLLAAGVACFAVVINAVVDSIEVCRT
jgi:hypothetical protein